MKSRKRQVTVSTNHEKGEMLGIPFFYFFQKFGFKFIVLINKSVR
jgi:hypothetical protein